MNKKLLQSVREYKKQSIITPLLVTLEVLMEVLIPLEMAKIIDIGITIPFLFFSSEWGSIKIHFKTFTAFNIILNLPHSSIPSIQLNESPHVLCGK